jgi:hypothetical protein
MVYLSSTAGLPRWWGLLGQYWIHPHDGEKEGLSGKTPTLAGIVRRRRDTPTLVGLGDRYRHARLKICRDTPTLVGLGS